MTTAERIQARIDPKLKASAERVFKRIGLSPTEAIRLFYRQVEVYRGLPFDVRIPNETTLQAIRDIDERRNLKSYPDFDAFLQDIKD